MASLSITEVRKQVMNCPRYSSLKWHMRVSRMSNRQVYAIYQNFLRNGYFDDKKKTEEPEVNIYHQMTIFEYMNEKGELLNEEV